MEGPPLRNDQDAVGLIEAALSNGATLIALPVERLGDDFFRLSTRIAGEVIQKFLIYRRRVAIVGDISGYLAQSASLRAFVLEANRGRDIWFVNSLDELDQRLKSSLEES